MDNKKYKTEIIKNRKAQSDFFVKVVFMGDLKVGKTSLVKKLIGNKFEEDYNPTNGYEFKKYLIKVNGTIIKFQIWDMSGDENYRPNVIRLYRNAQMGILVYSICSRESFNNLENWIIQMKSHSPTSKIFLLGNKSDLGGKREVSYEEGKNIYEKYKLDFFKEINAIDNFTSPNFMEIGAISIYKDYENNINNASISNINESIMLIDDRSERRENCCI